MYAVSWNSTSIILFNAYILWNIRLFSNHDEIWYHSEIKIKRQTCIWVLYSLTTNYWDIYLRYSVSLGVKKLQAKFRFNFSIIPSSAQSLKKACSTISLFLYLRAWYNWVCVIWKVNKWSIDINVWGTGGFVLWNRVKF